MSKNIFIKDTRFKLFALEHDEIKNSIKVYSFLIEENIKRDEVIEFIDYLVEKIIKSSAVYINIYRDNLIFCYYYNNGENAEIIFTDEDY